MKWLTLIFGCSFLLQAQVEETKEGLRDKQWNNRTSNESTEQLASEFVSLLSFDPKNRFNKLKARIELRECIQLAQSGKNAECLESFYVYFLHKLKNPSKYGISPSDLNPRTRGIGNFGKWPDCVWDSSEKSEKIIKEAELLLQGKILYKNKEETIGIPGKVNWWFPLKGESELDGKRAPDPEVVMGSVFWSLGYAYSLTHEKKYLKGFEDFMDDWSLNSSYMNSSHPCKVPSVPNGAHFSLMFLRMFAGLANACPEDTKPFSSRVFAQCLKKILLECTPNAIEYIRSNTHNWTPHMDLLLISLITDEFITAPRYFRESRRRNIEDNAVTQNLRDGTENQQDSWYNTNYHNVISAFRLLDNRSTMDPWKELPWIDEVKKDPQWFQEIRDHLEERVSYQIHNRTPQNELPIPWRGGDKRIPSLYHNDVSYEAYQNPLNASIVSKMEEVSSPSPSYHSEWFPYGGFNIVRDGWEPDSDYGAMFTSPQPSAYGGYRGRSNNNSFGLSIDGQDALIDDAIGHYMYPGSPLLVDQSNQFFHARDSVYKVTGLAAHKTYLVSAWLEPAPWRWHSSERFNLMEGIYDGPYANEEPAKPTLGVNDTLNGIVFQRKTTYLRSSKLWIITDRLTSGKSHEYQQRWMIPSGVTAPPSFQSDEIRIDSEKQQISTESQREVKIGSETKKKSNLTLFQVSSHPLRYSRKSIPKNPSNHYMPTGREEISATWSSMDGTSQVVTLIQPRRSGEKTMTQVSPLKREGGVIGFEAKTEAGDLIQYLSAPVQNTVLSLGAIQMKGESLVLSGESGMALGCKSITVGGKDLAIKEEDFEFSYKNGVISDLVPIYRTIAPVFVGPQQNTFNDVVEMTLSSKTPGVEIRYTLDGRDPTPQSPLYEGPVKLTETTTVKARAYRPEVKTNPPQTSGTHATAVSLGVFVKKPFLDPATPGETKPGLKFRYWEDDWKKLFVYGQKLTPKVSDVVSSVWDLSQVPESNPPVGNQISPRKKYYAVSYSGYIRIPEDGVYTFHAPSAFGNPEINKGSEIRVYVGNKIEKSLDKKNSWEMNEWYPSTRIHAYGKWSIPLKKGLHPIDIFWMDYRTTAIQELNLPYLRPYVWTDAVPDLKISGPGIKEQPIPDAWLSY